MSLTPNDYQNLLKILARAEFRGLEEAEIGIQLRDKLVAALRASVEPKKAPALSLPE